MSFVLLFAVYMFVGVFGYAGWGDPINWPLLIPVALVAAWASKKLDPKS